MTTATCAGCGAQFVQHAKSRKYCAVACFRAHSTGGRPAASLMDAEDWRRHLERHDDAYDVALTAAGVWFGDAARPTTIATRRAG